ncbi:MAG TPA: tetratricopeptide repeat-containing glycosyltransferase family protein [Burkholderiales bacterium]|nr:tetratricopeptide repeat-containing glycosyltransferase family protein [Burkholderiales bacterium]HEX2649785.1 tetratricopeptide repeat-containing glycosyltransferase family protein [Burkholderiales bacterium]
MNSAEESEERCRRILMDDPENGAALRELGGLLAARGQSLQSIGDLDAAAECYEEAVALDPSQAPAHNNLGNIYLALGRPNEAAACFRSAIAADAALAEAHLNLGALLHRSGELGEAVECYRAALALRPGLAEASLNLGHLLEERGDAAAARDCYEAAVAARPDMAEAHFNLALRLLQAGDFRRGWEEYEWRFRLPELAPFWPHANRPRWEGADLRGKTILLYAEQGFGDALQFVRYVPLVAARGGKVILSCSPRLMALFATVAGVTAVHNAETPAPEFDLCCPLLSLPRIFGTTLETVPAATPYLHPPGDAAARWRARLALEGAGLKVGLFWSTESKNRMTPLRSLELRQLAPLARSGGVRFYSLQRGAAAAQPRPQGMALVDLSQELADFADDAALIASLDLVITINTATAHLAGALGRPVWTLIHFPPDWRWLEGRTDSPWYPSMRLFQRGRTETWETVLERVGDALQELESGPRPKKVSF